MAELQAQVDPTLVQKAMNEYALKGAIDTFKEFYTGYSSPYRKQLMAELESKGASIHFELPDILAVLNEQISKEIDIIANEAIAKTFLPLVSKFLTRAEKTMNFSDVLKAFISENYITEPENAEVYINEDPQFGWLSIEFSFGMKKWKATLHEERDTKKDAAKKYAFLGLPYNDRTSKQTMTISLEDGAKIEMPFTRDILSDNFTAFIARLVMARTVITMDTREFDDDMFPQKECHCD